MLFLLGSVTFFDAGIVTIAILEIVVFTSLLVFTRGLSGDGETEGWFSNRVTSAVDDEIEYLNGGDTEREQSSETPRCTDCGEIASPWTIEDGELVCGNCADSDID